MTMRPVGGWQACQNAIGAILADSAPAFIGRIGGSDTDALAARIEGARTSPDAARAAALAHWPRVRQYNGYYDRANDPENFLRFLDLMHGTYRATRAMSLVGNKLLTLYFAENLNPVFRLAHVEYEAGFRALIDDIDAAHPGWLAFPFNFYETLGGRLNLFRVFETALAGKRVLVASPFGASIRANWHNRQRFFRNYAYPDFEVSVLDTPITYEGLPPEMYPHANWFDTLAHLKSAMAHHEFDILLLSCGSYAMPLGLHARDALGRQAIYVGGILQLYFGIMGRRYENPFFLDALDPAAFILPVERQAFFRHISLRADSPTEAFGAYF